MPSKKRGHNEGNIEQRSEDAWRLRYRVDGERFSCTVHGSKADAKKRLNELLNAGYKGQHIPPDKMLVESWIDQWISIGAPGSKKKEAVGKRTLERYEQLLRVHVKPELGRKRLQQIKGTDVDALYAKLDGKVSGTTAHHVHTVFKACLQAAVRGKLLARNPVDNVAKVPSAAKFERAVFDDDATDLGRLVAGFKGHVLYPVVATSAFTGARLREVLALSWEQVDLDRRIITVSRAIEEVKGKRGFKEPKTERGRRTFVIDENLAELLAEHRRKQQQLVAGIADGAGVDLSLVRLPPGALLFPGGGGTDLTKLRCGRAVSRTFKRQIIKLGFPANLRLHDMRGSHESALLDAGLSVHVVAGRCGHDAATLLRTYAKRTKKADEAAADVIATLSAAALK